MKKLLLTNLMWLPGLLMRQIDCWQLLMVWQWLDLLVRRYNFSIISQSFYVKSFLKTITWILSSSVVHFNMWESNMSTFRKWTFTVRQSSSATGSCSWWTGSGLTSLSWCISGRLLHRGSCWCDRGHRFVRCSTGGGSRGAATMKGTAMEVTIWGWWSSLLKM